MLTTKQFMDKLKELDFIPELDRQHERITVYKRGFPISMVFFHVDIYGTNVNLIGGAVDSTNADVFKLLSQYLETPDEDRAEEEYYYVYWSDVCGGEFFLDRGIIDYQESFFSFETRRTFYDASELENSNGTHYLKNYQFTEEEVKSIPTKWKPSYFGGLGFTQYEKVKDDKVAR